jgi:hypothetical protein
MATPPPPLAPALLHHLEPSVGDPNFAVKIPDFWGCQVQLAFAIVIPLKRWPLMGVTAGFLDPQHQYRQDNRSTSMWWGIASPGIKLAVLDR